jgi:hypothetical protein
MTDDPDLLETMRRSGGGQITAGAGVQFCQACQFLGKMYVTNQDGQSISHARNYCGGCGHVVCDRHKAFSEDDPRRHHHGVRDHLEAA